MPQQQPRRTSAGVADAGVTRLAKHQGWRGFGFGELWRSRELLTFLAMRDIKVRYKQTFFGVAWAVGQPLITMVVFTLIFGRLAEIPSEGLPYSVFVLGGLVPWGLVATAVPATSTSLLTNVALITKVRIHSMLLPAASVLGSTLDLLIATALLIVYAAAFGGVSPGPRILLLPAFLLLAILVVLGVGLLLSSVSVLYRDIRYLVPFGVQLWLFLTPVVYPIDEVPGGLRWLYALNPMVGVVQGFRWSVLGTEGNLAAVLPPTLFGALLVLLGGAWVFRRIEPVFPDVV